MDIKTLVRKIAGKIAGVNKVQEQVDTLFYFLDSYVDVTSVPKAVGPLRKLQEGDVLLLQIVDSVCKKHNLQYWLDAGTCLGAVRHKGFIPWDDDMDIAMFREDYERALPILNEELGRYGIEVEEYKLDAAARIGIGYMHSKTGLWIDVFPYECVREDFSQESMENELYRRISKYQKIYQRKKKKQLSRTAVFKLQQKYVADFCSSAEASTVIYTMEFNPKPYFWKYDDLFPLVDCEFEQQQFPMLKNADIYLKSLYGETYNQFPRTGVEHHGGKQGKLQTWAEKSGTDMDQVITELKGILAEIENRG